VPKDGYELVQPINQGDVETIATTSRTQISRSEWVPLISADWIVSLRVVLSCHAELRPRISKRTEVRYIQRLKLVRKPECTFIGREPQIQSVITQMYAFTQLYSFFQLVCLFGSFAESFASSEPPIYTSVAYLTTQCTRTQPLRGRAGDFES